MLVAPKFLVKASLLSLDFLQASFWRTDFEALLTKFYSIITKVQRVLKKRILFREVRLSYLQQIWVEEADKYTNEFKLLKNSNTSAAKNYKKFKKLDSQKNLAFTLLFHYLKKVTEVHQQAFFQYRRMTDKGKLCLVELQSVYEVGQNRQLNYLGEVEGHYTHLATSKKTKFDMQLHAWTDPYPSDQ